MKFEKKYRYRKKGETGMEERSQRLLQQFEKENVFPYTSVQEDESKWQNLVDKGKEEVKKYLEKKEEEIKSTIAVEELSQGKKKEMQKLLKNVERIQNVSVDQVSSLNDFKTWFQSLYNALHALEPPAAKDLIVSLKDIIETFWDQLEGAESRVMGSQTVSIPLSKIPTFEKFFNESFFAAIKKEISSFLTRFSSALYGSRKHMSELEKAQHQTSQASIENQLVEQTTKLRNEIREERKNFDNFLVKVKQLLETFPHSGTLTCPGVAGVAKPEQQQSPLKEKAFFEISFPKKRQVQFAKELRDVIVSIAPEFQLTPPPPEESITRTRCDLQQGAYVAGPHQAFVGKLFHPRLKMYKGFLLFHDVGTGKTFASIEGMYTWYQYADPQEYKYVTRDVLILAPTKALVSNWEQEVTRFFEQKQVSVKVLHRPKQDDTRVLEIGVSEKKLFVIIQAFPFPPLDGTSFTKAKLRNWVAITKENQKDFDGKNKLDPDIYSRTFSILKPYKFKKKGEEKEKKSESRFLYPPKGLVIVDEAHIAINPIDVHTTITHENYALQWTIGLKYMPGIKLLIATATPMSDDDRPLDVIKMLNLLKFPNEPNVLKEGVWRAPTPKNLQSEKYEAEVNEMNALEKETMKKYLSNDQIYQTYAGLVSYMSLQYDYSVYPRVTNACPNNLQENIGCPTVISANSNSPCRFNYDGKTFTCLENKEYSPENKSFVSFLFCSNLRQK